MRKSKYEINIWNDAWWLNTKSNNYSQAQVKAAFEKLKEFFDEKWLKNQMQKKRIHPILPWLVGSYPFMLDFLVELGLSLIKIEKVKNSGELVKRLLLPNKFPSFLSHLEMASWLIDKDFTIDEFEPRVEINQKKYNPDLSIKFRDWQIYLEIHTLFVSARECVKEELTKKISKALSLDEEISKLSSFEIYLNFTCNFWKKISLENIDPLQPLSQNINTILDSYSREIIKLVKKIPRENLPFTTSIKGLNINLNIGKIKGKKFQVSYKSPPLKDEIERGIQKLSNKVGKKLPQNVPSIIGLKLFSLIPSFHKGRDLAEEIIQNEFWNYPKKYKHIIGGILFLRSYPKLYERRFIENPNTEFKILRKFIKRKL